MPHKQVYSINIICLIGILLCSCLAGESIANGPPEESIVANHPAYKGNQATKANQEKTVTEQSITPPTVIPSNPEAITTNQSNNNADPYAKDNLRAQQEMAEAAGEMVTLTWAQVILAFLGTIILSITVYFTARSAAAAANAATSAQHSADSYKFSERAWITYLRTESIICRTEGGEILGYEIKPHWTNSGKTPAIHLRASIYITERVENDEPIFDAPDDEETGTMIIGPGSDFSPRKAQVALKSMVDILNRNLRLFIMSRVTYNDIFSEEKRHTTLIFRISVRVAERLLTNPETFKSEFIELVGYGQNNSSS